MGLIAAEGGAGGSMWNGILIPLILMFAVFYFLLIRPQQKKQRVRNQMLQALKVGDRVVTIGGIHGSIVEITDDTVVVKVNDASKLTLDRAAVNGVVNPSTVE